MQTMLNVLHVYLNMSRLKEALIIIENSSYDNPINCSWFAKQFWPDSNMHLKSSNTGNGACRGKAAWLCAGSYLAKLAKKELTSNYGLRGYYITKRGKQKLLELSR